MAKRWYASILISALAVALVAGFWWGKDSGSALQVATGRQSGQETETPTPEPTLDPADVYDPIYTSEDAVARALEEIPEGVAAQETITRLVTEEHFWAWSGGPPASSAASVLLDPVWVVGVISDGLKVSDVMFIYNGPEANDPVEGAFYAWQANTGFMLGQGALASQVPHSRAALDALANEELVIQMPAVVPTSEPTLTPDPLAYP